MEMEVISDRLRKIFHVKLYFVLVVSMMPSIFTYGQSSVIDSNSSSNYQARIGRALVQDTADNLIYVSVHPDSSIIIVKRYDGNSIVDLPRLNLDQTFDKNDTLIAKYYKGDLYLLGDFNEDASKTITYNGIARLVGSQWMAIPGIGNLNKKIFSNSFYHPPSLTEYKGKLLISGPFDSISNSPCDYMVTWDGVSLSPITVYGRTEWNSYRQIFGVDDTLYVFSYTDYDQIQPDSLSVFVNDTLVKKLDVHSFKLNIQFSNGVIFRKTSSSLLITYNAVKSDTVISTIPLTEYYYSKIAYKDGRLFFLGGGIYEYYNGKFYLLQSFTHVKDQIAVVNNSLYYTYNYWGSGVNISVLSEIKISEPSRISGKCFIDLDKNCVFDTSDIPLKYKILNIEGTNFNVATDANGDYRFSVSHLDTLLLKGLTIPHATINCNDSIYTIAPKMTDSTADYIYHLNSNSSDLSLDISSNVLRRGRKASVYLKLANLTAWTGSVQVRFIIDSKLELSSASHGYSRAGDTLEFEVSSPETYQQENIWISFTLPIDSFAVGDTVSFSGSILTPDDNNENNNVILKKIVVGPYDPNIKQSFPEGGVDHTINQIDYTIEFQNIGSASAINVKVVDTVDTRLPLRYLKVTGTSHPNTYSLSVKNNVLTWTFNGINLPDSASDPDGSKGFISYTAKLNGDFNLPGDRIDNKAYIYFDYESPVVTNIATVFIEETVDVAETPGPSSQLLKLYPNPFENYIKIQNLSASDDQIKIWDYSGRLITEVAIKAYDTVQINTIDLSSGLYFITTNSLGTSRLVKP